MKPTIGKIVLYRQPKIPGWHLRNHPGHQGMEHPGYPERDLAAIITQINDDGSVDLIVFESVARPERNILSQDVTWTKDTPQPRRWRWPEELK